MILRSVLSGSSSPSMQEQVRMVRAFPDVSETPIASATRRWAAWAVFPVSLAFCVWLVALRGYVLTSASIDFVWHLTLTTWIAAHGSVPLWTSFQASESLPVLSTMTFYPPVAHVLAALLGKVLGSSVYGILAIAALSIFIWYAVVCHALIRSGCAISALLFSILVGISPLLDLFGGGYAFHGGEILGNFFFAQICGTALCAVFLYVCVVVFSGWTAILVASACAYMLGWTYLLSEIEFVIGFVLFAFREVAYDGFARRADLRYAGLRFATAVVVLGAITMLHPQVGIMKVIAANDGGIAPYFAPPTIAIVAAATLLVALTSLAFCGERNTMAFVFCLCASASAVAILQEGLLVLFKLGSPYAVRKTTFDVFTSTLLVTTCLVGSVLQKVWRMPRPSAASAAISATVFAFVVTVTVSGEPLSSARPFARMLRAAQRLMASAVPSDAPSRTVTFFSGLASNPDLDPILNISLQTVAFQDPVEESIDFTFNHETTAARYAAVPTDSSFAAPPDCLRSPPVGVGMVLVDLRCALLHGGPDVFTYVPTVQQSNPVLQLSKGWSGAEPDGTWSNGPTSRLQFAIGGAAASGPLNLALTFADVFVNPAHPVQRVVASVDDERIGETSYRSDEPVPPMIVTIPGHLIAAGITTVTLTFPDAASPASLKLSTDSRALAVKLAGFQLTRRPDATRSFR